ncbi:MAG: ABC transporter ATP-binding protein [Pararhodobacter sp.]
MSVIEAKRPEVAAGTQPLLSVEGLKLDLRDETGWVRVLDDVSFHIRPRETLGVVGESGCGKSMTALSIMQLVPPRYARTEGRIRFGDKDLLKQSTRQMNKIRGRNISMIFQEPMSALDPVFTVGAQIRETVQTHFPVSKREAEERAIEALDSVGIADPRSISKLYPMSLSGGMRQRVMIAMALVCEPELLIADEPTTALDVTIQAQIMDLLLKLSDQKGTAIMCISHNLALVSQNCDRMITMYGGQVIEGGPVGDVLAAPRHPYTTGLLHSVPAAGRARGTLNAIPGRVPSLRAMPPGCRFEPRCSHARPVCQQPVALEQTGARQIRCHRWRELEATGQ